MKQIKVKPIQVEPIRVSPVLVTSTSVESIYVSGESDGKTTVNKTPLWEVINRTLTDTECLKANGDNTGMAVKTYQVTYQDFNPNSQTYGETYVMTERETIEDLESCPLRDPSIPTSGYYRNAVQDYDGNYYDAVIIGDQVWLAQNLYATHYANGDNLSGYNPAYGNSQTNGLVYYYDPQVANKSIIDLWKVPSYAEVQTLVTYVTTNYAQEYSSSSAYIAKALSAEGDWMFGGNAYSPGDVYHGEYNTTGFSAKPNMGDSEGNYMLIRYLYGALMISCDSPYVLYPTMSQDDPYGLRLMYNGTVSQFLENYVDLNPQPYIDEDNPNLIHNAVQDYDGNWYDAVIVGEQVWLASNLRTTHYADGTALTERQIGYQTGGGIGASGYLIDNSNFYYGDGEVSSSFISNWTLPSYSTFNTLFTNYTVKDVASKTNWASSYVVGSPGKNPNENNSTLLNFEPIGEYNSQYARISSKNEFAVFWEGSLVSYGEKDYFGVYYSNSSVTHNSAYGVMMPIRLIYNGTATELLQSLGLTVETIE